MILVSRQAHGAGFDPKRNVLAHQRHPLALSGKIRGAGQNPRVVGISSKAGRQYGRVAVVELDMQSAALGANRDGLIETAVLEAQVVEESQRLAGEPAQFVVMALGL